MKILMVGGTGLVGAHAALHLRGLGHEVTVASRSAVAPDSAVAAFASIRCNYLENDLGPRELSAFDALVFSAGHDLRQLPKTGNPDDYWEYANTQGIPKFFARVRESGIGKAIYIGSFYSQAAPHLADKSSYVRSRLEADKRVRALSTPSFSVCSLNVSWVIGTAPGIVVPHLQAYVQYALGLFPIEPFAPPGGVNFIDTAAISEAIAGALLHGQAGHPYLIGGTNLTFKEYLESYYRAVGRPTSLPVRNAEHPMFPHTALHTDDGSNLFYENDPAEKERLGYKQYDLEETIRQIVGFYRARL